MIRIKNGDKFNYLTVLEKVSLPKKYGKSSKAYVRCRCICGKEKLCVAYKVSHHITKSCGCVDYRQPNPKSKTKIYKIWAGIKQRCLNENCVKYKDYGGRGIKISDSWLKFEAFYKDMGDKPEGKTLDRVDNNGNYCKENCRWATPKQQSSNTRSCRYILKNDTIMTVQDLSKSEGISRTKIMRLLRDGYYEEVTRPAVGA